MSLTCEEFYFLNASTGFIELQSKPKVGNFQEKTWKYNVSKIQYAAARQI